MKIFLQKSDKTQGDGKWEKSKKIREAVHMIQHPTNRDFRERKLSKR